MTDIGTRMKENYEHRSRFKLTRRTPVIIRVDGRAFHTYTKQGFKKPFDNDLMDAMLETTQALLNEAQGAKLGYCQSDEISILLTDWDNLQTDAWFDYNLQKICSISASLATNAFNQKLLYVNKLAQFDARAFNIPLDEVDNYFVWRAKDWYRNSITMYAQSVFSHKQLHGKSCEDMHEMLHRVGKNWTTDLTPRQRNGTFVYKIDGDWVEANEVLPCYDNICSIVQGNLP